MRFMYFTRRLSIVARCIGFGDTPALPRAFWHTVRNVCSRELNTKKSMHGRLTVVQTPVFKAQNVKCFPFFVFFILCLNPESRSTKCIRAFYGFKFYFYN